MHLVSHDSVKIGELLAHSGEKLNSLEPKLVSTFSKHNMTGGPTAGRLYKSAPHLKVRKVRIERPGRPSVPGGVKGRTYRLWREMEESGRSWKTKTFFVLSLC